MSKLFLKSREQNYKNIRIEKDINTGKGEIKISKYYGEHYIPYIFESSDELDNFLDKYNLRKLN